MRRAEAILIGVMAISLGGCTVRKQQVAKAAPPAPKPVAPPKPAPPPEPLSIPQTTAELPAPQPITPEALATTLPPGEPPPPLPAPIKPPARVTPRPGAAPPRPEPAPPAAVTPTEPERQPISEVIPPNELNRMREEAEARRREVAQLIRRIPKGRLRQQQNSVDRITVFLKQADDAEQRGDMRQASELAGRALVLARELK
jgi:hypothetical protein